MTPDAGLKSTPSTSKLSEEDAQPHDDDDKIVLILIDLDDLNRFGIILFTMLV